MSLLGRAVVAIWNDILPEARENFLEWHDREHIPERVAIPGFLRGRRYVADYGRPEYFTLYEAADEAVLTGPDYLARLDAPTPWTREATAAFRNTSRGVCGIVQSQGLGEGGVMLTLRFDAAAGRADDLAGHLRPALDALAAAPGVRGVHLCVADQAASGLETAERRGREVGVPSWVVLIEGATAAAVDAACDRLLAGDLAAHGAAGPVERGLYRLEFCLPRAALDAAA